MIIMLVPINERFVADQIIFQQNLFYLSGYLTAMAPWGHCFTQAKQAVHLLESILATTFMEMAPTGHTS
jgi:hypothetical protein